MTNRYLGQEVGNQAQVDLAFELMLLGSEPKHTGDVRDVQESEPGGVSPSCGMTEVIGGGRYKAFSAWTPSRCSRRPIAGCTTAQDATSMPANDPASSVPDNNNLRSLPHDSEDPCAE